MLLLSVAIGAVVFAFVLRENDRRLISSQAAEVKTLRQERLTLSQQLGVLDIADPIKAYVIQVETEETRFNPRRRRYRVYLPELHPEAEYMLYCASGTIASQGFPYWEGSGWPAETFGYSISGSNISPGELTLDVHLVTTEEGDLRLDLVLLGHGSAIGTGLHDMSWLLEQRSYRSYDGGVVGEQKIHDPLGPIPVMRLLKKEHLNDEPATAPGVLVWIDPKAKFGVPGSQGPASAEEVRKLLSTD
ncbi:hypothetical protein [Pseudobythopirellula maris]|uniref:hypothetical protein n=1 Tax=Pseudobythopirellula maris TaxID=2527991 RepID=UPI0011B829C5|nr:hypothetical protein [Pseudobythopirellula maris]